MKNLIKILLITMLSWPYLVGCAPQDESKAEYQEIKEMIVDALSSKEGREAIIELMRDPEVKQEMIIEDTDVKSAVSQSLLDPKNRKILESAIKDPKFAAEFAKNIEEEHKELLTSLLRDPDYRDLLIEVFNEPDFKDILMNALTGSAMRTQMQEAAKEAFTTPAARLELMELLRMIQKEELEIQVAEDEEGEGEGEENGEQEDDMPTTLVL